MEEKNKNRNNLHQETFGYELPADFFEKSKKEILSKTLHKKEVKTVKFFNRRIVWMAAAGIALVFAFALYNWQNPKIINNVPKVVLDSLNFDDNLNLATTYISEDEVLLNSLLMNDDEVESYVNNAFIADIRADEYLDNMILDDLMPDDLY